MSGRPRGSGPVSARLRRELVAFAVVEALILIPILVYLLWWRPGR